MTLALLLLWMTLGTPDQGKLSAQPSVSQSPASTAQHGWSEWRCAGCEVTDRAIARGDHMENQVTCNGAICYDGNWEMAKAPKPHRWFAETHHGQPLTSYQHTHPGATRATPCDGTKELCWSGWMIVDETVELDICLEHGETRVREWK